MKNILLNLKKIDQTKINHTEKGNEFVALKMVKLKKPKGLITHMLFHRQDSVPIQEKMQQQKIFVGTVCGFTPPCHKIQDGDPLNFYMLFVEGGKLPTYIHATEADAKKQASALSEELKKRVYILSPVAYMDYVETPIAEMIAQSDNISEENIATSDFVYTPAHKKKRKRIPVNNAVKK